MTSLSYDKVTVNILKGRKKKVETWKREDVITQKASPSVSLLASSALDSGQGRWPRFLEDRVGI